jgi:hypothetical protein
VRSNGGAAGGDAETIQAIEQRGTGEFLAEIQAALRAGRYRPSPVKRRYIPKADGKQRPLGIPTVRYYYAEYPLRPLLSTAAVLNLDMIARDEAHVAATEGKLRIPADTSNLIDLVGGGYSKDLAAAVARANRSVGLTLDDKYERDSSQNVLFRCDHFPFLGKGVPALWIFGGFHPGYHEASDTPEKLNWAKLEKVMGLTWNAVWELDKGPKPRFEEK